MEILTVIPVRGTYLNMDSNPLLMLNGKPLISYTLEAAKKTKIINRVIVSTDSPAIVQACKDLGTEAPFIRPEKYAQKYSSLGVVLKHAVDWLSKNEDYHPDIIVLLEVGYPFRNNKIIERVTSELVKESFDTVFIGVENRDNYWKINALKELELVTNQLDVPREYKACLYREVRGLALATRSSFIEKGEIRGDKIGMITLKEEFMAFKIISHSDLIIAEAIAKNLSIFEQESA